MRPDWIGDRVVVLAVSGGKDSTACSLWLTEQGIEHRRVFADTGWEHPLTYAHVDELTRHLGPIERVGYPGGMEALVRAKGMFASRTIRFCTEELKVKVIAEHLARITDETGLDVVNATGMRSEESAARANIPEREWSKGLDAEQWRPILTRTERWVLDMHAKHDVPLNPLYGRGHTRVGCYPCLFANKTEIRLLEEWAVERIESLEAEVNKLADARLEKAGTTRVEQGYARPSFFQRRTADHEGSRGFVPIREVVAWAKKNEPQGRQLPLFGGSADAGCLRWGFCEAER